MEATVARLRPKWLYPFIQKCIEKVDIFDDVKKEPLEKSVQEGVVNFIPEDLLEKYLDRVEQCSINPEILKESDLTVIYTPLNGTENKPVRETFSRVGIKNLTVAQEQENMEGNSAFKMAIGFAERIPSDLLLATNRDFDRGGIAVKSGREYTRRTGNETGSLLPNHILSQEKAKNRLSESPVTIKTIATSAMTYMIVKEYGTRAVDPLTGFKYIGEQTGILEQKQRQDNYIFGFEESCGFLPEIFVREKVADSTSLLICEMLRFTKKMNQCCLKKLKSYMENMDFGRKNYYPYLSRALTA